MGLVGDMAQGCSASASAPVFGSTSDANTSADYYMYTYKVVLCQKRHSHDWGACPFAHEKEKARRRDPRAFKYSSCICPNAAKGECPNGLQCPYAHTLFEYWLHPSRFRTQMCRSGLDCKRALCFFAHTAAELRQPAKPVSFESVPETAHIGSSLMAGSMLEYGMPGTIPSDMTTWPAHMAPACTSNSSFTSLSSGAASSSYLPVMRNNTATVLSCPDPDLLFGQRAAINSSSQSAPLTLLSASNIATQPMVSQPNNIVSSADLLLQLQLQRQQEAQLKQAQLLELQKQENIRTAIRAQQQQQNHMVTMGLGVNQPPAATAPQLLASASSSMAGVVPLASSMAATSQASLESMVQMLSLSNSNLAGIGSGGNSITGAVAFNSGGSLLASEPRLPASQQQVLSVEGWL